MDSGNHSFFGGRSWFLPGSPPSLEVFVWLLPLDCSWVESLDFNFWEITEVFH